MQLKEINRKYILVGMVVFIIIGIFAAKILGSKQNEQFLYEDMLYAKASQMYQGGNYIEALSVINELIGLQPKSEEVNYLGGLIKAHVGEYNQSAILLQKTMDLNPYKVEDAIFMLQFGEMLFMAERYEDARVVLEKAREWWWEPEEYPNYQERVTEILNEIYTMREEI